MTCKDFKGGMKLYILATAKSSLILAWIGPNPVRAGRRREGKGAYWREGAYWLEWVVMRWQTLNNGFQTPGVKKYFFVLVHILVSLSMDFSISLPGKSADMALSFHSLQSLSWPISTSWSQSVVVTSVFNNAGSQRVSQTRWWWCEGGPWGRSTENEKQGSSKSGAFSSCSELAS